MPEGYTQKGVIKAMKIQEVILRAMSKQILWSEAAEIIGVSYRTMKRWKIKYKEHGYDGVFDKRTKQPSPKRVPLKEVEEMLCLYREKYWDFNTKHFYEHLVEDHGITRSYTFVKTALQGAGLVAKEKTRGKHRKKRPRRPLPGMMLHLDGSPYEWLPDLPGQMFDLLVLMDDAHNEVYGMKLVPEEDTLGCMELIKDCIASKGLFCSLYTDRASHFFWTPVAGGKVQEGHLTQIGRALKECNIEPIPSYSPQGRGRSERMNGTLQGRLPFEIRLKGIKTLKEANQYLKDFYIPYHNKRFKVKAGQPGSAFVPIASHIDLERIFSIQEPRVVNHDNTVHFKNMILQIEPSQMRVSFAKCRVLVHEHTDQTLSISYGPHILGSFDAQGKALKCEIRKAA